MPDTTAAEKSELADIDTWIHQLNPNRPVHKKTSAMSALSH